MLTFMFVLCSLLLLRCLGHHANSQHVDAIGVLSHHDDALLSVSGYCVVPLSHYDAAVGVLTEAPRARGRKLMR